jgi:hypothetical protein
MVIGLPLLVFIILSNAFIGAGIGILMKFFVNKKIELIEQAMEIYCRKISARFN